jgi:hypothetical protein
VFKAEGPDLLKRLILAAGEDWAELRHLTLKGRDAPPWPVGPPPTAAQ